MYSIIVPVYNEEEVIDESYRRLSAVMKSMGEPYELIFVNDGSRDRTAEIIYKLSKNDKTVKLLDFSRNFGHQPAVSAGMMYAKGDAVVLIDADLQDPPEEIITMAAKWKEGYDVVYGKRISRQGEGFLKILTAKLYYRILKSMTSVEIPVDTGDFRLMDKKVVSAMNSLQEKNRYVRGLVSWVGFKQVAVEYKRDARFAGVTKYPLKKMLKLAADGITAFSYKPLKIAIGVGFFISAASFLFLLYIVIAKIFFNVGVVGWASTIAIVLFSQGIVLIMLGIMGEYIGRIYDEVKNRPNYIVKEAIGFDEDIAENK